MDEQPFDMLARRLARAGPRRPLFGGLAGAVLTRLALPETALACKREGRKCDRNQDCCDGARCKGGKNGKCRCKGGFTKCGGKCKNFDTDENHCGNCNTGCAAGIPCSDGTCCIPVRGAFEEPAGSCVSSDECCAGGTCCTFNDPGGPQSICIDLLTHQTACGSTCETVVNCLNFQPDRQCVNGECVEV